MSEQIQTNVAQRVMGGERAFQSIQFPVTGDSELDFCAAVILLANSLTLNTAMALRALDYLKARFGSREEEERQQRRYLEGTLAKLSEESAKQQAYPWSPQTGVPGQWHGAVVQNPSGIGSAVQATHTPKTLMQVFAEEVMQVFAEEEAKAKSLKRP